MPLINASTTASWLALLGVYFWCWWLSEYSRQPKPVRVAAPVGPSAHSFDGGGP
jgi:hypothetical protein